MCWGMGSAVWFWGGKGQAQGLPLRWLVARDGADSKGGADNVGQTRFCEK